MNATVSQISSATRRLAGLDRPAGDDATDLPLETEVAPRRPIDGAVMVFAAPVGAALLVHGMRSPIQHALNAGFTGLLLVGLALLLLAGQGVLGIRAGVLALRGDARGVDLAATAVVASLSACVVMFVAGIRLDYPGWGVWMLAALLIGMLRMDGAAAEAWYSRTAEQAGQVEQVEQAEQPGRAGQVERLGRLGRAERVERPERVAVAA